MRELVFARRNNGKNALPLESTVDDDDDDDDEQDIDQDYDSESDYEDIEPFFMSDGERGVA